jgi:hypothetical protein
LTISQNARSAISLARQCRERGNEARALSLLGQIALRSEPTDGAAVEESIHAALDLAMALGMKPVIGKCERLLLFLQQQTVVSGMEGARAALSPA